MTKNNKSIFDEQIDKKLSEARYKVIEEKKKKGSIFEKVNDMIFIVLAISIIVTIVITLMKIFGR